MRAPWGAAMALLLRNGVGGEDMNSTNIRPLIGLLGVLVAALSADLNEFVSGAALIDVRGALGISADPGRWIDSLYVTGTALGMAFAPWCAVTFTLTGLLQLAAFSFRTIKSWSRFAGDFRSPTSKCSAKIERKKVFVLLKHKICGFTL